MNASGHDEVTESADSPCKDARLVPSSSVPAHDLLPGLSLDSVDDAEIQRLQAEIHSETLREAQRELRDALEARVAERTEQLQAANAALRHELEQRDQVEKLLRESEQRFRQIIENAQAGYFRLDQKGCFLDVNEAWLRHHGYASPWEIIGQHFSIVVPEDDRPAYADIVASVVRGGVIPAIRLRGRRKDGAIVHHVVSISPVIQEDRVVGVEGFGIDQTRHESIEAELRRDEERFRTLLDSAPVGILHADAEGRCLYVNRRWCEMTGLSAAEAAGAGWLQAIRPEDREKVAAGWRHASQFTQQLSQEFCFVTPAGISTWIQACAAPLFDDGGNPVGQVCAAFDITDRQRFAELARLRERQLLQIFEEAPFGAAVASLDFRILRVNDQLCALTGYTRRELLRMGVPELTHPDDLGASIVAWQQLLAGDKDYSSIESRYICRDGGLAWVRLRVRLIRSESGWPLYYLAMMKDITTQKAAEEEARLAQEQLIDEQNRRREQVEAQLAQTKEQLVRQARLAALGQISASIAHQLTNPLTVIHNAIRRFHGHLQGTNATDVKALQFIDRQVNASIGLVRNLMEIAHAKEPVKEPVDLESLLQAPFNELGLDATIAINATFHPDPFIVRGDPILLRQVFENLLVNAAHAMPEGGSVAVEARHEVDCDVIRFRDQGPGVCAEVRDSLFDPLVTTKRKGTGLGLAICRQIIEHHGGTIELLTGEEPGAVFEIRLPCHSEVPDRPSKEPIDQTNC